jgi:hypothetical protein
MYERDRAAVPKHEVNLRPGQPEVQRHEDPAEQMRGEHRLDESRMVRPEVGDPVAGTHAVGPQLRGEPGDPLEQPGVGDDIVIEDQGVAAGRHRRSPRRPRSKTGVVHRDGDHHV